MAEERLDRIVKGVPAPSAKLPITLETRNPAPLPHMSEKAPNSAAEKYTPSDPLSTLPSSPPQIYLNLLILEASLRSQYLTLRARRRLHTFFLLLLVLWNSLFTYLLFFKPREDGLGIGGSVYWIVEMMEKVALMGGVLTGLLMWGTGQWERGVRWPRRWLHVANRGLRGMNTKIVIVKDRWWKESLGHMSFLFPLDSLVGKAPGSEWHYIEHSVSQAASRTAGNHHHANPSTGGDEEAGSIVEEDLAPGGDYIKLLLLPKSFSPEFRENWEEYRTDYWEKENERRSLLRQRLKNKKRQKAKQRGGWLWWTGLWRMKTPPRPSPFSRLSSSQIPTTSPSDEKTSHSHGHPSRPSTLSAMHSTSATTTDPRLSSSRRRSIHNPNAHHQGSSPHRPTSSRNSSRSSTPSLPETIDEAAGGPRSDSTSSSSNTTPVSALDDNNTKPTASGDARRKSVRRASSATAARKAAGKPTRRESAMEMSPVVGSAASPRKGRVAAGGGGSGGEESGRPNRRQRDGYDDDGQEEDSRPGTPAVAE